MRKINVYSPAKHHWGVGTGLRGPSVLFKLILGEGREREGGEGGGVSLSLAAHLLLISRPQCHKEVLALS